MDDEAKPQTSDGKTKPMTPLHVSEPLTPEEEKSLRDAWASIGGWERRDGSSDDDEYTCPLCNGEGTTDGFILDATNVTPATLGGYGIGEGLAAAELVAQSTGRLLATIDVLKEENMRTRVERDKAHADSAGWRLSAEMEIRKELDQARSELEAWTKLARYHLAAPSDMTGDDLRSAVGIGLEANDRLKSELVAAVEEARVNNKACAEEMSKREHMQANWDNLVEQVRQHHEAKVRAEKERDDALSRSSQFNGAHTAESWNAAHPVGTPVRYWPILPPAPSSPPPIDTTTRSEAWTLGDGTVVVSVSGKSGGVHLGHVELIYGGGGK